jgi:peptidoglycan/LPS O-acetylase OafA/YrhL
VHYSTDRELNTATPSPPDAAIGAGTGAGDATQPIARASAVDRAAMRSYGSPKFLDGLRGLAAAYVVVHHARILAHEGYSEGYLRHPDQYNMLEKGLTYGLSMFRFGHEAVLFFFVLSGFVIHLRQAKAAAANLPTANQFGWLQYMYRRSRRLYPPLLFALLLTFALDQTGKRIGLPIYSGNTRSLVLDWMAQSDLRISTLLGNLAFLMDAYVPCYGTNSPLWSLKFEWWFYMIYPAVWWLNRWSKTAAAGAMLVAFGLSMFGFWPLLLLEQVFSLMLVWWMGAILAEMYVSGIRIPLALVAPLGLLTVPAALLNAPPIVWGIAMSGIIAAGFAWQRGGRKLLFLEKLKPLGDMSYTLYVVHMPILVFVGGWLMSRSTSGSLPKQPLYAVGATALCLAVAWLAHWIMEKPFIGTATSRTPDRASDPAVIA